MLITEECCSVAPITSRRVVTLPHAWCRGRRWAGVEPPVEDHPNRGHEQARLVDFPLWLAGFLTVRRPAAEKLVPACV